MLDPVAVSTATTVVMRGCGYRIAGATYVETAVEGVFLRGADGTPETFEKCLFDPPVAVDLEALRRRYGVTEVGVHLVDHPGKDGTVVTHVFDIVGSKYYADIAGFIAEARAHGVSRRIPSTLDFSRLSEKSRIVLIHARGWIDNAAEYFAARAPHEWSCPKGLAEHSSPEHAPAMCASLYAEDLEGTADAGVRDVIRTVGSTTYRGRVRPEGVTPRYRHAIFASFPVSSIAVVRDADGGKHVRAYDRARKAAVPVHITDH